MIFDECHHLPGASYELSAEFCLAPFRLGLSATPERPDGREAVLSRLIGPTLYRKDIIELAGEYLAEYETVRVDVELTPEERAEYESERKIYLEFLRGSGIRLGSPRGWNDFLMLASQTVPGVRALAAYRPARALGGRHRQTRSRGAFAYVQPPRTHLIFTQDTRATPSRVAFSCP